MAVLPYPLNHLMVHGEETHLDGSIDEIWKKGSNENEQSDDPEIWCWCKSFNEDLIGSGGEGRVYGSICHEEYIPEYDASPDEYMLYISEVTDR